QWLAQRERAGLQSGVLPNVQRHLARLALALLQLRATGQLPVLLAWQEPDTPEDLDLWPDHVHRACPSCSFRIPLTHDPDHLFPVQPSTASVAGGYKEWTGPRAGPERDHGTG